MVVNLAVLERQIRCLERDANCKFGSRVKILGEGSFGHVVRGTHTSKGKSTLVAVKLAKVKANHGADAHAALQNECAQLRKVSPPERPHPHIVSLVLAGVMDDPKTSLQTTAMIMELCTEGSLYDAQKKHSFPMSRLQIIYEICIGLAYMHHQGVYHRDLKPENILLQRIRTSKGDSTVACKIADLGLATDKLYSSDAAGTIMYLPPEMNTTDGPYNAAKGDVFAVGVILLELLLGDIPWMDCKGKVAYVVNEKWTDDCSSSFDPFFDKSLTYRPENRTSAGDLEQMAWRLWQKFGKKA